MKLTLKKLIELNFKQATNKDLWYLVDGLYDFDNLGQEELENWASIIGHLENESYLIIESKEINNPTTFFVKNDRRSMVKIRAILKELHLKSDLKNKSLVYFAKNYFNNWNLEIWQQDRRM